MRGEEASGGFAIASFECGKDGGVLLDGIAPTPLRTERQIAGTLSPRQQRLVRLAQRRISRRANDQAVYLAIDGEIIVELAVPVMVLHPRLQEAKTLQFALGGALGRKLGGKPLDPCERFEQLDDAIRLDIGDPRAAVRPAVPPTLRQPTASWLHAAGFEKRQAPLTAWSPASTIQAPALPG